MSDITSQFAFSDNLRSGYERAVGSILRSMSAYADARSRRSQIEALEAKTDEELARLGIKRQDIAYHVFRDLFYV